MNSVRPERALARRAVASMVALSTGAVLALSTAGPALAVEGEAPQERVLQSVDVQVAPDGTLTNVDGTVVQSTSEDAGDADSSESEYAPDEVATELPLRVMTAWRTEDGVGTDLADLDGYDGEIRIDVTVQNLTVKPQTLTYDVAAESRKQAALVGSPLTVVAAADLGDLASDSVVTAGQTPDTDVTNGVLGKGQDGETQVQWATILAPPQLGASARFSLVVDAKDFEVPDLDISVQPGLVTDPSLGALVDSAFNPQASQETQLQQDTIALITDVNGVLARAGATISDVRQILSGSAETLGEKTVADLQSSTQSIATSMRTLGSALGSLDQQITTTLQGTEDAALSELQSAVQTVDQLLGDTRGGAGSAQVLGNGCSYQVRNPGQGGSLYDSMVAVATQLNGYAQANDECRAQLVETLRTTIGPENPTDEICSAGLGDSVSCSLLESKDVFVEVAQSLEGLTADVTELLNPDNYTSAVEYAKAVVEQTEIIQTVALALRDGRLNLAEEAQRAIDILQDQTQPDLTEIQTSATAIATAAGSKAGDGGAKDNVDQSRLQQMLAREQICALDDPQAETSAADQASVQLVGHPCEIKFTPSPNSEQPTADSASGRLGTASTQLATIVSENGDVLDSVDDAQTSVKQVADILQETVDVLADTPEDEKKNLGERIAQLEEASLKLTTASNALQKDVGNLSEDYTSFASELKKVVGEKTEAAVADLNKAVDPQIEKVATLGQKSQGQIDTSFTNSSNRMGDLADELVVQGRASIEQQKRDFASAQQQAAEGISGQIRQGLARIGDGVTASTRDMSAASSLLTADLRKVLLDLGQREVNGGGLLGAMTTSAQTAKSADVQLANATRQTTAYSNVRSSDVAGILLRQAQAKAAMQMLADMPAFELDLSAGTLHRTVYNYRIGDGQ